MPNGLLINGCGEFSDTLKCPHAGSCGCKSCEGTCTESLPADLN